MRAYFDPLAAQRDVSGVIRIERAGIVTQVLYGHADWSARTPIAPDTRFAAGSITKSITATILLKLAERGAVNIAAPITTYLPAYRHGAAMTLDHVLRHTSGLPRNIPDEERAAFGPAGLVDWLNVHPPTDTPGARESYSNLGYEVLAHITELVSGESYAALAQRIIFDPLGMRASSIEAQSVNARSALPHVAAAPPEEVRVDVSTPQPIGPTGLFASVADMVRWSRAVRDGTIVNLRQADGKMVGSVLAFEEAGRTAQFLQGTIRGSGAGVGLFPDDVVVAYAFNLESYPQHNAQRVLAKIAYGVDPGTPSLRPPATPLADAHRELAGTYESESFGQLRIYERDGEMRVLMLGLGIDQYATPVSGGRLCWRAFNFLFSARRGADGAIEGLDVEQTMFEGDGARRMTKIG